MTTQRLMPTLTSVAWPHWLFWPALALYVAVLPVKHTIALRYLAFTLLLTATAGLLATLRQWPRFPLAKPWLAYGGVAVLSLLYAASPATSFEEIRTEIVYCALVFCVATTWGRTLDTVRGLGMILAGVNFVLVLIAFQYVDLDTPMDRVMKLPPLAFAGVNSNFIVSILPLLAFLSWDSWRSGARALSLAIALVLIPMDIAALMVSYTRQTSLALAAGLLCWGVLVLRKGFTWRRLMAVAAVLLAVAGLFVTQMVRRGGPGDDVVQLVRSSVAQDIRWQLWRFSLEKIAERPLTGSGFGRETFDQLYADFLPDEPLLWHAHNMIINKGIQMGIPGMAVFLALWLALARELARHLRGAPRRHALAVAGLTTVVVVFAKNMTDDFFVRDIALLFWLLMGSLIGSLEYQESLEKGSGGPGRLSV
ncbi:MAG: O-antigen ligase family protein [Pseudomonadota bacterium]